MCVGECECESECACVCESVSVCVCVCVCESVSARVCVYLCVTCCWPLLAAWRYSFLSAGHMDTGRHSDTPERRTGRRTLQDTLTRTHTHTNMTESEQTELL